MKKVVNAIYQTIIIRPYFAIRSWWPFWYWILNRTNRLKYRNKKPSLDRIQNRIIEELKTNGIATTTLDEFIPETMWLERLQTWETKNSPMKTTRGKKKFLREYWDLVPEFDITNPFLEFAISRKVVEVVESYMNMRVRLKQYHLGKTIPSHTNPEASQNWHRDPQEKRMCKIFIYLNDVDENTGPFTYLKSSTYGNKYGNIFPQKSPEGSYPSESEILNRVDTNDIVSMVGKAGTIIFCDTSGLHFGGRAISKERIMFTAFYASPSYTEGSRYRVPKTFDKTSLNEQQKFLLSGKPMNSVPNYK